MIFVFCIPFFSLLKLNIFQPIDEHRMPEKNFVTENNMKNIITALPDLDIADSNTGNGLPEPIVTTASKVLIPHVI